MHPLFDTLPQQPLLLHWQMDSRLAPRTTTALIFLRAGRTLNKQQMTPLIPAIGMRIGRLPALMTTRDHFITDALPHPVVKNKILPPELIFQPLLFYGIGIVDDPALQVKYI